MPKILVNYNYNKKEDKYTLSNYDVVFADMPLAIMDMGAEYEDILVVPVDNVKMVVDKKEFLKTNKAFYLVADGEVVREDKKNGTLIYLPRDTDISELRYINGQLVKVANNVETTAEDEIENGKVERFDDGQVILE